MNKKAETKLLSIWWFFVLVIIGAGVVMGTSMFKSDKLDVREAESAILVNRLIDCSINQGKLVEEVFQESKFFNICGLDSTILDKSTYYYIKISAVDINTNRTINEISLGNQAFEQECKVAAVADAKKYPRCFETTTFTVNSKGELLKLNFIAGSNYEFGAL